MQKVNKNNIFIFIIVMLLVCYVYVINNKDIFSRNIAEKKENNKTYAVNENSKTVYWNFENYYGLSDFFLINQ